MGNPFVHVDLATDDAAKAKKFYKKIFDWEIQDIPGMNWSSISVGDGVGGGMGAKNMPKQPSAWTAYVTVDDVKKTIAKAKKAGATIIVPYAEVGDMGSLGVFADPEGATIGVWQFKAKPKRGAKKSAKKSAAEKSAAKSPRKSAKKKSR